MRFRLLTRFEELPEGAWDGLLARSPTQCVFLTLGWLRSWWETLGEGELRLALAERDGRPVALAPLYESAGTVAFLGDGSSDYLDFLGELNEPEITDGLLTLALDGAAALRLVALPERSATPALLEAAASRLGLAVSEDDPVPTPTLRRDRIPAAAQKRSLVRHEGWFRRNGELAVVHATQADAILPQLDRFFDQHVRRCVAAPYDSLFENERHRDFYRRLAGLNADWLRFTRIDWDDAPIAFHFGMSYRGSFLWYKPSFELDHARRSPGEVLLRQLLLAAYEEGAHAFDFGLGDEAFKHRFATSYPHVRTITLTGA